MWHRLWQIGDSILYFPVFSRGVEVIAKVLGVRIIFLQVGSYQLAYVCERVQGQKETAQPPTAAEAAKKGTLTESSLYRVKWAIRAGNIA